MRKNLLKKMTAAVLSVTMVVGMTGIVSAAHAANGANVATSGRWESFSVCTRDDYGVWEDALKEVDVVDEKTGEVLRKQTKGQDYATEGYIAAGSSVDQFQFYVKNSGWDGEYNPNTGELVGDNPWGMTATLTGIPVEHNRYYTISFSIKSTLKAKNTVKDETTGEETTKTITTKHILFKAYDPISRGEPSVEIISATGASTAGYVTLDSSKDAWQTVTATIKIPEKKTFPAEQMGIKFALGSFLKTYPDEIAMSGNIYVKDFKVTAGTQYTVKLTNGSTTQTQYINAGGKATMVSLAKAGYTLTGYKTSAGAMYNFNSAVNKDLTLTAVYKKTAKPAKPKSLKVKTSGKKKVKVTFKKVANANGYEIKYSYKKNMKGAKTKTTSKTSYTVKKLKSKKIVYVKVRAFTYDSAGNKVFGKLSARKKAYVK